MTKARRFLEFISHFIPTTPTLPVMHSCVGWQFKDILDTREIIAGEIDSNTSKKVSFFFYGKPSYRPKSEGGYSNSLNSALFSLILDFNNLPIPDGILPFDSGGYDIFLRKKCGNSSLSEFYLPQRLDTPGQFIAAFFGSNRSYYDMKIRDGIRQEIDEFDFHSESLINILTPSESVPYDQRAGSIELHYTAPIALHHSNLLAIIAPDSACDNKDLQKLAAELDADLLDYVFDLDDNTARQRDAKRIADGWLKQKGLIAT